MSEAEDTMPEGRVGFRDIYRAVGESEVRIVAALNSAILPLTITASDHEARLRMLEVQGSPEAREAIARIVKLESDVTPLALLAADRERRLGNVETAVGIIKDEQRTGHARSEGIRSTFTGTQRVIITIAAICAILTVAIDIGVRVLP